METMADVNGGSLFLHGFQRGVVQPLIEGGFGEPPDLPDLDGGDLSSAGLAVDRVRHDTQVSCHFTDVHDPCHHTHPLNQTYLYETILVERKASNEVLRGEVNN